MQSALKAETEYQAKFTAAGPQQSGGRKAGPESKFTLIAKILIWQLIAFLVVEAALFVAGLGEEEIFKLDPELGFRHMSSKKVTWRSEGFAVSYFNEDGLREKKVSLAKPAGVYRIALLGDSLTESLQVPLEQSFSYKLQEELGKGLQKEVQVLNFGCSGYSTVQEYLQLKKQVLKYKPDLVLLCYNSRDCFENWSPPDEVLTNVRPLALHLPGSKLVVDSSPVQQWMKTPRARFLKQFEFFREHSRLWGLYAQAELDWSMHNQGYKTFILFLTRPGKAIRACLADLQAKFNCRNQTISAQKAAEKQAVHTSTESNKSQTAGLDKQPAASPAAESPTASSMPKTVPGSEHQRKSPESVESNAKASDNTQAPPRLNYQQLIARTLGSLLAAIKDESGSNGARFAVIALPVRSALFAKQGLETSFNDFDYDDELKMLTDVCTEKSIDLIDLHSPAKLLQAQDRDYLFYLVHLTPRGHDFVASKLGAEIKELAK